MTHNELLAKIDKEEKFLEKFYGGNFPTTNALRAVLELAKPRGHKNETDEMYIKGWNAAMSKVIQAIKKELR